MLLLLKLPVYKNQQSHYLNIYLFYLFGCAACWLQYAGSSVVAYGIYFPETDTVLPAFGNSES